MKGYDRRFLSKVKKAVSRYGMIEPGDRIAAAVSGGKDSIALLYILWLLQRQLPYPYDFCAVHIDAGWSPDLSPLVDFCREKGIPFYVERTAIGAIVFEHRSRENPCALCAHLRRGALVNMARLLGCTKLALAHHSDDLLETFLMNWLYTGRLATFLPVTRYEDAGLAVIRPLIYLRAATLASLAREEGLPVLEDACPARGHTGREAMRRLVKLLAAVTPDVREKLLTALEKAGWLRPSSARGISPPP
ncbi:tRNA lysidine(34) synthetase [Desulfovirgula thermocuniculi]|uniref:tRNA lysidine(34) synthetase n=1 Tax=Desulfovirgula thermocuniculi TaxID=348842 RepID=UPI0003FA8883|nr:ATP-binding protein [Desulfovirgula thermocuniculi]